eukprot:Rhum_TRINITY_DN15266_c12_g1::Rhum_TRINITY_DN15266_c12_g1_i1::g.147819::m.147819
MNEGLVVPYCYGVDPQPDVVVGEVLRHPATRWGAGGQAAGADSGASSRPRPQHAARPRGSPAKCAQQASSPCKGATAPSAAGRRRAPTGTVGYYTAASAAAAVAAPSSHSQPPSSSCYSATTPSQSAASTPTSASSKHHASAAAASTAAASFTSADVGGGAAQPNAAGTAAAAAAAAAGKGQPRSTAPAFVHEGWMYPPGLNRKLRRAIQFSSVGSGGGGGQASSSPASQPPPSPADKAGAKKAAAAAATAVCLDGVQRVFVGTLVPDGVADERVYASLVATAHHHHPHHTDAVVPDTPTSAHSLQGLTPSTTPSSSPFARSAHNAAAAAAAVAPAAAPASSASAAWTAASSALPSPAPAAKSRQDPQRLPQRVAATAAVPSLQPKAFSVAQPLPQPPSRSDDAAVQATWAAPAPLAAASPQRVAVAEAETNAAGGDARRTGSEEPLTRPLLNIPSPFSGATRGDVAADKQPTQGGEASLSPLLATLHAIGWCKESPSSSPSLDPATRREGNVWSAGADDVFGEALWSADSTHDDQGRSGSKVPLFERRAKTAHGGDSPTFAAPAFLDNSTLGIAT